MKSNKDEKVTNQRNRLDFRTYTKQIWLAGLGAFSRAEEEGNRLFDSLVKVGEELEAKTAELADHTVERTVGKVEEVKEIVSERVNDTREKVERALDERVNLAIAKIGLTSQNDINYLIEIIERLEIKVDGLTKEVKALKNR